MFTVNFMGQISLFLSPNHPKFQYRMTMVVNSRDVIVLAFPGTLLLSEWIATKAIPGKTGPNHIPDGSPNTS